MLNASATMLDGMMDGVRADWERDGFVVLRGYVRPDEVAEIRANIDRYISDVVPGLPGKDVQYEDKSRPETMKQLQRMFQHDPYFEDLFRSPRFVGLGERLLGAALVPQNMQWFNKPAASSLPTPPHQDAFYFMIEPLEAVSFWMALDEVDEENGCLRYVAGSHRGPLRPHGRTGVLGFSQGVLDWSEADVVREVPVRASPGDVIIHHGMTIHRAEASIANARQRRALAFFFYSVNAVFDQARFDAYQTKLHGELAATGRI
jgi:phytanoyl-CoA hydroxylase